MSAAPSTTAVQAPETPKAPVPVEPRGGGRWKWVVLVLVLLGGAYALYRAQQPAPPTAATASIRTVKAVVGSLDQTMRLTGQTSAGSFATVVAPQLRGPERNSQMTILHMAKSGSMVKKGDLVVQIDAQQQQDHIADVQDIVNAAAADIVKRQAEHKVEWDQLQQTLRVTKAEWEKAKLDYRAAEVRTEIERELLKLSLDEAEARYRQSEKDLVFKQASQSAEIKILGYTRDRHQRHLERHARDIRNFTIYAPMSGLAVMESVWRGGDMTQVQEGDQLQPGQKIMKIVDPGSMQLEANVNQAESSLLRIGQKARVELDGFKDVVVEGKVYSIGALATRSWRENYYIRNIPVRLKLDTQDSRMIPDLSASATVVVSSTEGKPVVPLAAVRTEKNRPFVLVKAGEGFTRRDVQIALESGTHAAVTSGLSGGEEVRLN